MILYYAKAFVLSHEPYVVKGIKRWLVTINEEYRRVGLYCSLKFGGIIGANII